MEREKSQQEGLTVEDLLGKGNVLERISITCGERCGTCKGDREWSVETSRGTSICGTLTSQETRSGEM